MIYEYRCPKGHITEKIIDYAERETPVVCFCGRETIYQFPSPRIDYYHMGADPDFTTASDKWDEMHKQKLRIEES